MKSLAQVLEENGHKPDYADIVDGLYMMSEPWTMVRDVIRDTPMGSRTPVSVHASQEGEWLATLRLEDLLAMIPDVYGKQEVPE